MPPRKTAPELDTPVEDLWNLSDLTAGWLRELGIATYGDLVQADLYATWAELRARHRQVSALMFYALWGATHNCKWDRIPEDEKAAFLSYRETL